MMRIVLVAALVLAGCVEGETLDIPDHDGGWEADSFAPDSEIDAAEPEPDADIPDADPLPDADPPPPCNVFAWPDADGDGFGDENAEPVEACDGVPPGHVTNADDCYDGNVLVKPGQTNTYSVHRGDGSFDYNCDGEETKLHPDWRVCGPDGQRGWSYPCLVVSGNGCLTENTIPDCGHVDFFTQYGAGMCHPPSQISQRCR